jgi:hypothetical protein
MLHFEVGRRPTQAIFINPFQRTEVWEDRKKYRIKLVRMRLEKPTKRL